MAAKNLKESVLSFVDEAQDYMNFHSGIANQYLFFSNEDDNDGREVKFFLPYQKIDPLFRASTVITGPLVLAIQIAGYLLLSVYYALKIIIDLLTFQGDEALTSLVQSFVYFGSALFLIIPTVLNPFVNLIDLIGGAFTSIGYKEIESAAMNSIKSSESSNDDELRAVVENEVEADSHSAQFG